MPSPRPCWEPARARRRLVALLVTTALSVLAGVGLVSSAAAHDYLVGSVPEQGETVQAPPTEISLEFNTSIGERFAQVAVVDDAGTTFQVGEPVVDGPTLTQTVDGLQPGMAVTISYRVVSSDGHPIGGTVPFAVAVAAGEDSGAGEDGETSTTTGTTAATTTDSTTETSATTTGQASTVSPVVWLAAAAVAVLLAGAAMTLSRRRARASTSP